MDTKDSLGRQKTEVKKRRIILPDGRYLIYFSFEDAGAANQPRERSPSKPANNHDV